MRTTEGARVRGPVVRVRGLETGADSISYSYAVGPQACRVGESKLVFECTSILAVGSLFGSNSPVSHICRRSITDKNRLVCGEEIFSKFMSILISANVMKPPLFGYRLNIILGLPPDEIAGGTYTTSLNNRRCAL